MRQINKRRIATVGEGVKCVALTVLAGSAFLALPALASNLDLASYVRTPHNLGQGGSPATPAAVASDPLAYIRSEAAWQHLTAHVGERMGRPITSLQFRTLLASDRVRLQPCIGSIVTAGISADGNPQWFRRECHEGEQLVAVRALTGWHVVASQGCWNPVWTPAPGEPLPAPAWTVPTHPVEIKVPGHPPEQPRQVPEPGMWIAMLGLFGWLVARRCRKGNER